MSNSTLHNHNHNYRLNDNIKSQTQNHYNQIQESNCDMVIVSYYINLANLICYAMKFWQNNYLLNKKDVLDYWICHIIKIYLI